MVYWILYVYIAKQKTLSCICTWFSLLSHSQSLNLCSKICLCRQFMDAFWATFLCLFNWFSSYFMLLHKFKVESLNKTILMTAYACCCTFVPLYICPQMKITCRFGVDIVSTVIVEPKMKYKSSFSETKIVQFTVVENCDSLRMPSWV